MRQGSPALGYRAHGAPQSKGFVKEKNLTLNADLRAAAPRSACRAAIHGFPPRVNAAEEINVPQDGSSRGAASSSAALQQWKIPHALNHSFVPLPGGGAERADSAARRRQRRARGCYGSARRQQRVLSAARPSVSRAEKNAI